MSPFFFKFEGLQWLLAPIFIFSRYLFYAALLYGVFYIWKRREWFYLKIQQKFPSDKDLRREIGYSILTSFIFGLMAWLFIGTPIVKYTQFYRDISAHGIGWLVLSVPLTLLVHDTYFYWMHRLMHHPKLYKKVHLVHHKSVNPSPWAAYAFHPSEAFIEAGIIPVLLFLMPLHPVSFLSFVTIMLWFNVYGHLGYELFPKKIYAHPLGRWLNTSIYHNQHHERFDGNYSLYFTFWDRFCGTLRTDAAAKVAEVHDRIAANKQEESFSVHQTRFSG
jgi:Delta7-sterol 5-desaturase